MKVLDDRIEVELSKEDAIFERYLAASNLDEVNACIENWDSTLPQVKASPTAYPDDDFEFDWKCKITFGTILACNLTLLSYFFI